MLYFVAAGAQLGALVWLARKKGPSSPHLLTLVVAVGVLARICMLPAPPSLSDDVWRYRWEGRVQAEGVNPYLTPPADPTLAGLRDGGWLRVNHPSVPAIYGPPLQLLFRGVAALPGPGVFWFKLVFLAADLGLLFLLIGGLRRRGLDPLWALVYAWHPLVVLEVAGQGHLEILPVALLAAALELEWRGRARLAAIALGTAIAAKYLPLLLLPTFLLLGRSWRERAARLGWVALPGLVCVLPFLSAGKKLVAGLGAYGVSWSFNGVGFEAVDGALRGVGVSQALVRWLAPLLTEVAPGFDPATHTTWIKVPAKLLVGLLAGLVVAWFARRAHRAQTEDEGREVLAEAALVCALLFLACSPTVHPWYALWVVPFLLQARSRLRTAGFLFSLAVPLVYEIQLRYTGLPGSWVESGWVRAAVWLPVLGVALGGVLGPRLAPRLLGRWLAR
ncbi:MAG: DUF2029 domain-containing protein [Planctomycetes bacterium]|nr:DUF2029 domain-containing protein [Planctomycetota bacterium]